MAKGITAQEASQRLAESSGVGASRYQRGTQGKGGKWVGAASQAGANFKVGMQEFLAKGDLGKAMQEAGASAYDTGVSQKGVGNYSTGVAIGAPKYATKVQKFAALWNQPLSTPKGAKRSQANLNRMTENAKRFSTAAGK